jgi:hypothetical protein
VSVLEDGLVMGDGSLSGTMLREYPGVSKERMRDNSKSDGKEMKYRRDKVSAPGNSNVDHGND